MYNLQKPSADSGETASAITQGFSINYNTSMALETNSYAPRGSPPANLEMKK